MNSNDRLNHGLSVDSDRMTTSVLIHTRLKLIQMLHLGRLAYESGTTRAQEIRDAIDYWLRVRRMEKGPSNSTLSEEGA